MAKKYRIAKMVVAGSFALLETFSVLFGTGCTPTTENTNTSVVVTQNENPTETTASTTSTENVEIVKPITEEELMNKTEEELWREYNELKDLYIKEQNLSDKAQKELLFAEGKRRLIQESIAYLEATEDTTKKEVKAQIKDYNKQLSELAESIPVLEKEYDEHSTLKVTLRMNLEIYLKVIRNKELAEDEKIEQ